MDLFLSLPQVCYSNQIFMLDIFSLSTIFTVWGSPLTLCLQLSAFINTKFIKSLDREAFMTQPYTKLCNGGLDEPAEFDTILGMVGGAHANVVANCAKLWTELECLHLDQGPWSAWPEFIIARKYFSSKN